MLDSLQNYEAESKVLPLLERLGEVLSVKDPLPEGHELTVRLPELHSVGVEDWDWEEDGEIEGGHVPVSQGLGVAECEDEGLSVEVWEGVKVAETHELGLELESKDGDWATLTLPVPLPQTLGKGLDVSLLESEPMLEPVALMEALPQFEGLDPTESEVVSELEEVSDILTLRVIVDDGVALASPDTLEERECTTLMVKLDVGVGDTLGEKIEVKLCMSLVVADAHNVGDKDIEALEVDEI